MSNEWFTDSKYIRAAEQVMGVKRIELDPASCELANQRVQALRYYTEEENGLAQVWQADTMFCNPPYGVSNPRGDGRFKGGGSSPRNKSLQVLFVNKALSEYKAGNIKQAILLVTANITCPWFQPLYAYPLCIPLPKPTFLVPDRHERQRQVFGNAFVYMGPNEAKFVEIFSKFGPIMRRIDTPPAKLITRELWEVGA